MCVALDDVDLTLHAGDVHMLLGENGAGKSTLMKILSGAYRKDAGEIRIDGQAVEIGSPRDALALGIRVIYQELNLVPQLSVAENIFLGAMPARWAGVVDWRALYDRASRLLTDLGLDASTLDARTPVSRLGMAQRQMVEIAKALALRQDPARPAVANAPAGQALRVLVMDEPTSSLTSREVTQLFSLIERLTARGVAIVYITHRLDEVFRIGRRVTVLRDGRHVTTRLLSDVNVPELVRLMANRDLSEHFPKVRAARGRRAPAGRTRQRRRAVGHQPVAARRRSAGDCRPRRRRPHGAGARDRRRGPVRPGAAAGRWRARSASAARRTRSRAASACFPKIARRRASCRG